MYLCIDQGNTRAKIAVFDRNGRMLEKKVAAYPADEIIRSLILLYAPERAIVSSVVEVSRSMQQVLSPMPVCWFSHETPVPISNAYKTPTTLGLDRLAAAIGAKELYPGEEVLVIDAGTAITYDRVSAEGVFLGGNIAPGMRMRGDVLHEKTGKLPLIELGTLQSMRLSETFGETTEEAIALGVVKGMLLEIEGYVRALCYEAREKGKSCRVVLTGGDAVQLAQWLKESDFLQGIGMPVTDDWVESDVVLKGLFAIISAIK